MTRSAYNEAFDNAAGSAILPPQSPSVSPNIRILLLIVASDHVSHSDT